MGLVECRILRSRAGTFNRRKVKSSSKASRRESAADSWRVRSPHSNFVQVLRLCQRAGLVTLGHIALDGTKLKANASKHNAMSDERMVKEEARLQAEVDALLHQAEAVDAQDDARYGPDRTGEELPTELAFRDSRLQKIREAKAALEHEARAAAGRRR